jgi:hypothetical protein
LGLCFDLLALHFHPLFKLADGFALKWKFDLAIAGMHILAAAVPHEGHSDLADDAYFDQAGIKGMA